MRRYLFLGLCSCAIAPILMAVEVPAEKKSEDASCCAGHGAAGGKASAGAKQTTCPVSGKPIKADAFVEYQGQKIYFCGSGCQKKFKESPTQYLPAVYKQIYPQRVQITCPVMGEPIDPEVFTEYKGGRVYFCCKACISKFNANPAKYLDKLAAGSTEQVHCPVTGEPINPAVSIEEKGKKIYFCCKGCIAKYKADPAKFADALRPTAGLVAYGQSAGDDLVLCPICLGKPVHKRSETKATVVNDGMVYTFCSDKCAETFKADPAKYTKALREEMTKRASGAEKTFTCSMHPDVKHADPGKCPICGMKLDPVKPSKP